VTSRHFSKQGWLAIRIYFCQYSFYLCSEKQAAILLHKQAKKAGLPTSHPRKNPAGGQNPLSFYDDDITRSAEFAAVVEAHLIQWTGMSEPDCFNHVAVTTFNEDCKRIANKTSKHKSKLSRQPASSVDASSLARSTMVLTPELKEVLNSTAQFLTDGQLEAQLHPGPVHQSLATSAALSSPPEPRPKRACTVPTNPFVHPENVVYDLFQAQVELGAATTAEGIMDTRQCAELQGVFDQLEYPEWTAEALLKLDLGLPAGQLAIILTMFSMISCLHAGIVGIPVEEQAAESSLRVGWHGRCGSRVC
jgi:hypothetical protein